MLRLFWENGLETFANDISKRLQTTYCKRFDNSCYHCKLDLYAWASAQLFPGGSKSTFCLSFHTVGDATQMDVHKKKMSNVTATVATSVFPVRKLYTEHRFVLESMDISRLLNELQTVWITRISAKSYENTNKVPFNSNNVLFSCFSNVIECWKLREMRFCANGVLVLRICAPLQNMRFTGSSASFSLMLLDA